MRMLFTVVLAPGMLAIDNFEGKFVRIRTLAFGVRSFGVAIYLGSVEKLLITKAQVVVRDGQCRALG